MKILISKLSAIWSILIAKNFILLHNCTEQTLFRYVDTHTQFSDERDIYLVEGAVSLLKRKLIVEQTLNRFNNTQLKSSQAVGDI